MRIYKNRTNCRLCNKNNLKKIFKLKDIPISDRYFQKKKSSNQVRVPLTVSFCKNCKNVQINEVINPKLLWKNYTYLSGQTNEIKEHFKEFSKNTKKKINIEKKDIILDIGSNDGSLLAEFKKIGLENVIGVDPSNNIVKIANKKNIKTYHSFFNNKFVKKLLKKKIRPKIITAFNVFAHSDLMIDFIRSIKKLLKRDGYFIFEVQYLKDIIDKKIIGTFFHEHMNHYSVTALENFFQNNGLFLFDIDRVNIQKGSIIGYVCHKDYLNEKSKKLIHIIKMEKNIGLDKANSIEKIKKIITDNKKKATEIIKRKYKNKFICGFGAARSGALLAINYGFENKIKFIFDDHNLKVNKYSEINNSRVISSSKISQINPDLCIVLAYIHSRKIIRNNFQKIRNGLDFMILYPYPRLINYKNINKFLKK